MEVVGDRVARDVSAQKTLNLGVDVFETHLGLGLGENEDDRLADGAELASAVWPSRVNLDLPSGVLVWNVTRETLEKVREGAV